MNLASKLAILTLIKRKLDQGEGVFFSKPNRFYSEYVKDKSNRPTLHSYNSMIIYIDGLRQFGSVL